MEVRLWQSWKKCVTLLPPKSPKRTAPRLGLAIRFQYCSWPMGSLEVNLKGWCLVGSIPEPRASQTSLRTSSGFPSYHQSFVAVGCNLSEFSVVHLSWVNVKLPSLETANPVPSTQVQARGISTSILWKFDLLRASRPRINYRKTKAVKRQTPFQKTHPKAQTIQTCLPNCESHKFEALESCFPWLKKRFTNHLGASQRNPILKQNRRAIPLMGEIRQWRQYVSLIGARKPNPICLATVKVVNCLLNWGVGTNPSDKFAFQHENSQTIPSRRCWFQDS